MDLKAIKARLAAITPGKWYTIGQPWAHSSVADTWVKAGSDDPHISIFVCDCQSVSDDAFDEPAPDYYRPRANAEFIASAPADIRALVTRVEDLETENARLKKYEPQIDDGWDRVVQASYDEDPARFDEELKWYLEKVAKRKAEKLKITCANRD